jgi:hypothetical protein
MVPVLALSDDADGEGCSDGDGDGCWDDWVAQLEAAVIIPISITILKNLPVKPRNTHPDAQEVTLRLSPPTYLLHHRPVEIIRVEVLGEDTGGTLDLQRYP